MKYLNIKKNIGYVSYYILPINNIRYKIFKN